MLANAISIDGIKEWTCKLCSESNVWTRWRCRRCYSNIPTGLQGKYRQAVAAKSGDRLLDVEWRGRQKNSEPGSCQELRARIDAMEKKEGVQGGPSIACKGGGDSEDV